MDALRNRTDPSAKQKLAPPGCALLNPLFALLYRHCQSAEPKAGPAASEQIVLFVCQLTGTVLARKAERASLAPRLRQTLDCLLDGDGEKQVAARLALSLPTVHQYVTALYRHFGVSSRAELLAHFIRRLPRPPTEDGRAGQ